MPTDNVPVPDTFPTLLFAYSVIWGLLVLYFVYLGMRLRRLERRLSYVEDAKRELGS